jgi:hypothetical protein
MREALWILTPVLALCLFSALLGFFNRKGRL